LEEHNKLGGLTPSSIQSAMNFWLEEHYKLGGLTPKRLRTYPINSWKNIRLT